MDKTACAAALVLAFAGEASLRTGSRELLMLAGDLELAARAVSVPSKGIAAAARLLSDADASDAKMEAVKYLEDTAIMLKEVATDLQLQVALRQGAENLAGPPPNPPSDLRTFERARQDLPRADALTSSAERLVLACHEYRRVAAAISLVRHAAAEAERARHAAVEAERVRQQPRASTAAATTRQEAHAGRWWWFCLGRNRLARRSTIEDPLSLIGEADPPMPSPSPSATDSIDLGSHGLGDDKRSGIMGYALFGSIGLVPYLGPDKVSKKVELLKDNKLYLHIGICAWWTLIALGATLSAYAQSMFERVCALLCSRLGILGMNIMVILFMYCALDIDHKRALYWMLGSVCIPHVALFIAACWRRHF